MLNIKNSKLKFFNQAIASKLIYQKQKFLHQVDGWVIENHICQTESFYVNKSLTSFNFY